MTKEQRRIRYNKRMQERNAQKLARSEKDCAYQNTRQLSRKEMLLKIENARPKKFSPIEIWATPRKLPTFDQIIGSAFFRAMISSYRNKKRIGE